MMVGAVSGKSKAAIYANCTVNSSKNEDTIKEVSVMIDTGNLASATLISEDHFLALDNDSPMVPANVELVGVNPDATMTVIGRAKKAIEITFHDYSAAERDSCKYLTRPFVVRGLQPNLMLCHKDLQAFR